MKIASLNVSYLVPPPLVILLIEGGLHHMNFDVNFVHIGQRISEILTFEILERSDFYGHFEYLIRKL